VVFGILEVVGAEIIDLRTIYPHESGPLPVEELISRIKSSVPFPLEDIETNSVYEEMDPHGNTISGLYEQARNGSEDSYLYLKKLASEQNDPLVQGFFARYLLTMGNSYCFVDSSIAPEYYVDLCAGELHYLANELKQPHALELLSFFYSIGCGSIPKDVLIAKENAEVPARLGMPRAQNSIGYLHGLLEEPSRALSWFICGMRNNYSVSFWNMSLPSNYFSLHDNIVTDLIKHAVMRQYKAGQYNLAKRYEKEQQYQASFCYFHDLAQSRYILGYYETGRFFLYGFHGEENLDEAENYLSIAVTYIQTKSDAEIISFVNNILDGFFASSDEQSQWMLAQYIHTFLELPSLKNLKSPRLESKIAEFLSTIGS
jgi:TPR repeat protein